MHESITFDATRDGAEAIGATLARNGCVLVRDAIPEHTARIAGQAVHDNAARLREIVGREVNDMPLCFGDQRCTDPVIPGDLGRALAGFSDPLTVSGMDRSWYYEGRRNYKLWFWENGERMPNLIVELIRRSILPKVYEFAFGEEFVCPYARSVVRYQRADLEQQSYFFHQDGSYHSRAAATHTGITTWIALRDCGVDAPSLEVVPRALDEVLPKPDGINGPYLFCDENLVLERFGDEFWAPAMRAGDAFLFNAFVLHRTCIRPGMTEERQSADVRVFPASRVPDYAVVERTWMVDLLRGFR